MRVCLRRRGGIADSAYLLDAGWVGEGGAGAVLSIWMRLRVGEAWGLHTWHEMKRARIDPMGQHLNNNHHIWLSGAYQLALSHISFSVLWIAVGGGWGS